MRSIRPIDHVRALCDIGPRPPTSDAEARAAAYVKARLEAAGARDVSIERFRSVASGWRAFEIACVIALASSAAYLYGGRWAWIWSALLCILSFYIMLGESGFWKYSLSNFLPKRDSQNVYGKILPRKKASRKLIVLGHLDTNLTPILFHPAIVRYYSSILLSVGVCVGLKMLLFLLGSMLWGGDGLMIASIVLDVPILLVLLVVLHGDFLTPHTEGANDNATGAAVALSLAEFFAPDPLERTECWALCTGCEEAMLGGIQDFLERHAGELGDAYFVNLECLGVGTLRCISYEGMMTKFHSDPDLVRTILDAGNGDITVSPLTRGYTETPIILRRGLRAVTLMAFPEGSEQIPYWHRVSDKFENINAHNLDTALDCLVAFARKLDRHS